VQPRTGEGVIAVVSKYTQAAAYVINDVIQMVKVPKGAVILDVALSCEDLDTHATPTIVLEVGDGEDTDRYITGSTIGQAGGLASLARYNGHGYQYTANDTIDVKVTTAPATGTTDKSIMLTVLYTMHDDV